MSVEVTIKNESQIRLYNTTVTLDLPSGVEFLESLNPLNSDRDKIEPTLISNISSEEYNKTVIWDKVSDLLPGESTVLHFKLKLDGEPSFYIGDIIKLKANVKLFNSPVSIVPIVETDEDIKAEILGFRVKTENEVDIVSGTSEERLKTRQIEIKNNGEKDTNEVSEVILEEKLSKGIEHELESEEMINNSEGINYEFEANQNSSGTSLKWVFNKLSTDLYKNH